MRVIVDNLILMGMALLFMDNSIPTEIQVLLFVGTVGYAAFSYYIEQEKIQFALSAIWLLVLCFMDGGVFYLPVIWYHLLCQKRKWEPAVVALCGMALLSGYLGLMSTVWGVILTFGISTWLCMQTASNDETGRKLIALRDSDMELSMNLQRKNKELAEMKEYEVYTATLAERNRIAREIHDNVGHLLSRAILQVGALQAICKQENLLEPMNVLQDSLNHAMNSIRNSVHDLRDESVDVYANIRQALDAMSGYEIQFEYDAGEDMPKDYKYCFIAVTKEALSNIVKHSDGKKVSVQLLEHPGFYQLVVEDNGRQSKNGDKNGMGIENMEERVKALGGTFLIQRERGYRIFVSIPKRMENTFVS